MFEGWPEPPQVSDRRPEIPPPGSDKLSFRDLSILGRLSVIVASCLLVLAAAGAALKMRPSLLWAAVLGSAATVAVPGPTLFTAWTGSYELTQAFVVTSPIWLPAFVMGGLAIAGIIHLGSLALFLAAAARQRGPGHALGAFFAGATRSCGFEQCLKRCVYPILARILLPIIGAPILVRLVGSLASMLNLSYESLMTALLIAVALLLVGFLGHPVWGERKKGLKALLPVGLFLGLMLAVFLLTAIFTGPLAPFLRWLKEIPGSTMVRVISFVVAAVLLIGLLPFFRRLSRGILDPLLRQPRPSPGSFSPAEWKARIQKADAHKQHLLLLRTDHQALALTPTEFLEVLREIRPAIKEEPALSTYWDQRDQLEQGLRQERQG
jgi:hypothetical protein